MTAQIKQFDKHYRVF